MVIQINGKDVLDATQVKSGRFNMSRMPVGDAARVLTAKGLEYDPDYETGGGSGDMTKATYDPNADGILEPSNLNLSGKADASHAHAESDIANLATDLAGKASSSHGHAEADVMNLATDLAAKTTLSAVKVDTDIADAINKKHANTLDHDGGAQNTAIAGKANSTHSHAPGDVTGTAVITSDVRLSDARTPLAHGHAESDVTGLVTDLAAKETPPGAQGKVDTHAALVTVHGMGSKCLASNFTTSSVTAVGTNLTFAIAAGEVFDVYLTYSKATSATGLKLAIGAPTGCVIAGYQNGGGATLAAPLVPSLITAINTLLATVATGTGIRVCGELHFRVINSSTAGSITIQVATVTSNVATIYAGSKMSWRKSVSG